MSRGSESRACVPQATAIWSPTGRGAALKDTDNRIEREADRSQSNEHPCGNEHIWVAYGCFEQERRKEETCECREDREQGHRLASSNVRRHTSANKPTLLRMLKQTSPNPIITKPGVQ